MRINHNIASLNTYRQLTANSVTGNKSLEKLSSGLRINRAGDDAAGLAISEKMRAQIRGLDQSARNAQDGISMIQSAEGALNETHSILQRMRELAVQAANDTNSASDRLEIQKEVNQLTGEVTRIGNNTEFNTKKLINGDLTGAGTGATQAIFTLTAMDTIFATSGNSYKFKVGSEEYTITASSALATGTYSVATATKTVTVSQTAGTGTAAAAALNALGNADTSINAFDFTFAAAAATSITITAKSTGDYAGIDGNSAVTVTYGQAAYMAKTTSGADGTNGEVKLQVGANVSQQFSVSVSDMRSLTNLKVAGTTSAAAHGVHASAYFYTETLTDVTTTGTDEYGLDVTSATKATAAVAVIDDAISSVSTERAKLGAYQNRLEHTINNLGTSSENLTAAESRVRDVDMAKEMMEFTKNNILMQAAQAMLAQANQMPQGVLQLLR